MSEHADGNWKAEATPGGSNGAHWIIKSDSGEYVGHFYPDGNPRAEEDVTLMAAAPALLRALKDALIYMTDNWSEYPCDEKVFAARAAIKAADPTAEFHD